ncbi:hypothetical protein FJTKL_08167 [Diaporthe vaccinii]|uniref:Mitochondrial pyruvate carrier n=1 Tax=Diaporthe vaccinii TaxID=105482 RepID=A0ABR4ESV2_9PEZI
MSGVFAFIRALNQKIRSNKVSDYFCSTHFWGPASNFGIPIAAILDTYKSPDLISGPMTGALTTYAFTFMRYSLAVTPKNYLLFACHFLNAGAQLTQSYRWTQFHYGEDSKEIRRKVWEPPGNLCSWEGAISI